jgi:hypothetical protein
MKQHFELTALSPIHIGCGRVLYRDEGFRFQERRQEIVFDPKHYEGTPLPTSRDMRPERELRLHLQDGNGGLLLPGSSLKGALKTLWIADQLQAQPDASQLRAIAAACATIQQSAARPPIPKENGGYARPKVHDDALLQAVLGGKFDTDAWQRLRVGDASFHTARAYRVSTANYLLQKGFPAWGDKPNHWLLETIAAKSQAVVRLDWPWFDPWSKEQPQDVRRNRQPAFTPARSHPPDARTLLAACRRQSAHQLDAELKFWDTQPDAACMATYIERLLEIRDRLQACGPDACIVRIGYGSGFDVVTGRIPRHILGNQNSWQHFFMAVRGKAYSTAVPTPKTRKMVGNSYPLGFLQLRLLPA